MTLISCIPRPEGLYFGADKMNTKGPHKTRVDKIEEGPGFLYALSGTVVDNVLGINYLDIVRDLIAKNEERITVANFHEFLPGEYKSQEQASVNMAAYYKGEPHYRRIRLKDRQDYSGRYNPYFHEIDYCNNLGQGLIYTILAQDILGLERDKVELFIDGPSIPIVDNHNWANKTDLASIEESIQSLEPDALVDVLVRYYRRVAKIGQEKQTEPMCTIGMGFTLYQIFPDNSWACLVDENYEAETR